MSARPKGRTCADFMRLVATGAPAAVVAAGAPAAPVAAAARPGRRPPWARPRAASAVAPLALDAAPTLDTLIDLVRAAATADTPAPTSTPIERAPTSTSTSTSTSTADTPAPGDAPTLAELTHRTRTRGERLSRAEWVRLRGPLVEERILYRAPGSKDGSEWQVSIRFYGPREDGTTVAPYLSGAWYKPSPKTGEMMRVHGRTVGVLLPDAHMFADAWAIAAAEVAKLPASVRASVSGAGTSPVDHADASPGSPPQTTVRNVPATLAGAPLDAPIHAASATALDAPIHAAASPAPVSVDASATKPAEWRGGSVAPPEDVAIIVAALSDLIRATVRPPTRLRFQVETNNPSWLANGWPPSRVLAALETAVATGAVLATTRGSRGRLSIPGGGTSPVICSDQPGVSPPRTMSRNVPEGG